MPPSSAAPSESDEPALEPRQRVWALGDYSAVARHLLPASLDLVETVGIGPGDRVLDVGVGDGNTAIVAAQRGAVVTGIDLTPSQLDRARRRAASEGATLDLQEGDAEHLAFDDGSFDHVVSVFGVIFAPDHARALSEAARVYRPGGTVAITSWARGGWFGTWRERAASLVPPPPPGGPDAYAWQDPAELTRRFAAAGLEVQVHVRPLTWTFPSVDDALDFFLEHSGPFITFQEAATAAGTGHRVRDVLRATLVEINAATDGSCRCPAPYLLAVGRRPER